MQATIHGRKIAYDLHGSGEPVLFIHGFPFSRRMWARVTVPMEDDWSLILPDLRGFGESEGSERASMGDYTADLVALLDALPEPRPVTLVGFSMGGYIALEFVRRHPERVRALVLVDTRAQPDTAEGRAGRLRTAERVATEGSRVVADDMLPKLFATAAPAALMDHWHAEMNAASPQATIAALHAMAERPDSTDTLETISRPVLVVVGAEDRITPPADAEQMAGLAAGARLEVIPGAGHMTPVEQPQHFVAVLQQFLDDLDEE